jgi:hypothetical protein
MNHQQPTSPNAQERRKAYHAPKLEDYGEARELTQASVYQDSLDTDNGLYPFYYVSGAG